VAADPVTGGYWLAASDGGIFAFGGAVFHGSMGGHPLNQAVTGMAVDPVTDGYWLVASDGGIFAFGAPFHGSMGGSPLNEPIAGMAADSATGGLLAGGGRRRCVRVRRPVLRGGLTCGEGWCAPVQGGPEPGETVSMSFDLQHVTIHGHSVGYRREGDGPVLLLIHGIAGSSAAWREVMPTLAERFTVIAPDLIGHGHSGKPLGDYSLGAYASGMRDLMGALGVERGLGHRPVVRRRRCPAARLSAPRVLRAAGAGWTAAAWDGR